MTITRRIIIVGFIALTASLVGSLTAFAQTTSTGLSETQLEQIRANCSTTKATLDQLHANDALLRVNRGQLYESMSSKLMNNFNGRVVSNGLDARGLITITQSYQAQLNSFRNEAYPVYERQLTALIRIDCEKEPGAFYDALVDVRAKREEVHKRIQSLNNSIEDYERAIAQLKSELPEEVRN